MDRLTQRWQPARNRKISDGRNVLELVVGRVFRSFLAWLQACNLVYKLCTDASVNNELLYTSVTTFFPAAELRFET